MSEMVVYKIRHKSSGLFSKGGKMAPASWSAKGKNWNEIHHVHGHIRNNMRYYEGIGDEAEVIKLITRVDTQLSLPIVVEEVKRGDEEREVAREKGQKKRRLVDLKTECDRLTKEISNMEAPDEK